MMKKKLLFTLFAAIMACNVLVAQEVPDLEQTAPPTFEVYEEDDYVTIVFYCEDDAVIDLYVDGNLALEGQPSGCAYCISRDIEMKYVEFLAQARCDSKAPSDMVSYFLEVDPIVIEQTATPEIYYNSMDESGGEIRIFCEDEGAEIYYRYCYWDDYWYSDEWSEWMLFDYSIYFSQEGYYRIECYAIAPGKTESEHSFCEFEVADVSDYDQDYDFKDNGIYYTILSDSTVAVSKRYHNRYGQTYWLGDSLYYYGAVPSYSGNVVIPSTACGYTVTAIKREAFLGCNLTGLVIPGTVTEIGDCALSFQDINIILPDGLQKVGVGALYGSSVANSGDWGSSMTDIGNYAFSHTRGLRRLSLSDRLETIGKYAFSRSADLNSVTMTGNLELIGERAFNACKALTSVTLLGGVKRIGSYAFYECAGLTSLTLTASLTAIGNYAFSRCAALSDVTLPAALTDMGNNTFSRCTALTAMAIPAGVKTIGNSAFYGCTAMTSLTLPEGLTAINYSAFTDCAGLTAVTLPSSLTTIGYDAFAGCTGLKNLTIPAAVTSISARAFDSCSSLETISVETANQSYDSREDCNALIETSTATLMQGCNNTMIPASVTAIAERAFFNCTGLNSVVIPAGVTTIGNYAFFNCTGITAVTSLPVTPPVIDYWTFGSCYDATLSVPQEAYQDYKSAEYWSQFNRLEAIPSGVVGDIDGDGRLSISDVTMLINMLLNDTDLPSYCDANGDGKVSISDVTFIINRLLNP